MIDKMNQALDFLRDKYGVPAGTVSRKGNVWLLDRPGEDAVELLPHRVERRFTELKNIIVGKTVEDVSTFRFANFSAGGDISDIIKRELDLVQYLSDSTVVSVYAAASGNAACNIIFRLANGQSGCIECGTALPEGSEVLDRHEIIAKRGVASDRVVDTYVPQSSLYEWSKDGCRTFTDIDTELFGLPNEYIYVVRAAFAVLSKPELAAEWNAQAKVLQQQLAAVNESIASGNVVKL